ncbi:MAG TPA: 30S ribosome-binding factor RbfA [Steroidobacteraceae bacterium]|jgi:ribosome-binding factor A|nr:30S ribosome-binding factor RbfA [Steroidobacteraceae bacterium]
MTHGRTQRIESEIQRVLAALIAREVKDPRVGNVTVTAVSVAPDMGSARVFFTPFAAQHPPAQVREGLTHAAGFLRGELGRRLGLRHAPRLEFVFDESVESAARLTHLIDRAVAGDREHSAAAATEGGAGESAAQPSGAQSGDHSRR